MNLIVTGKNGSGAQEIVNLMADNFRYENDYEFKKWNYETTFVAYIPASDLESQIIDKDIECLTVYVKMKDKERLKKLIDDNNSIRSIYLNEAMNSKSDYEFCEENSDVVIDNVNGNSWKAVTIVLDIIKNYA